MTTSFGDRLNRLMACVHPPGADPYTPADVVGGLRRLGVSMSAPYLSQLRTGARTNPSQTTIEGLALMFRISPLAFTHDDVFHTVIDELEARNINDVSVRTLAGRAANLSPMAQQQLLAHIDQISHHHRRDRLRPRTA